MSIQERASWPMIFLAGALAFVPTRPVAANPGCPTSTLTCDFSPIVTADASASCGGYGSSAGYNLTLGSFGADAYDYPINGCCPPSLDASDIYTITGIPSGTPLSFRAAITMHLSAYLGQCVGPIYDIQASAQASISEPASGAFKQAGLTVDCTNYSCCGTGTSEDTSATIHLAHVAGEPFTLEFRAYASHSSGYFSFGGSVSAQLTFLDLPPGAEVVSCQGYTQQSATAARQGTWGALRVRYR